MEGILRILLEQVPALLCAVVVVSIVGPTTRGGAIVLGLVTFAVAVLLTQMVRAIWKAAFRKNTPPSEPGS
jgi:uncharacterized membrane protein YhhN